MSLPRHKTVGFTNSEFICSLVAYRGNLYYIKSPCSCTPHKISSIKIEKPSSVTCCMCSTCPTAYKRRIRYGYISPLIVSDYSSSKSYCTSSTIIVYDYTLRRRKSSRVFNKYVLSKRYFCSISYGYVSGSIKANTVYSARSL